MAISESQTFARSSKGKELGSTMVSLPAEGEGKTTCTLASLTPGILR